MGTLQPKNSNRFTQAANLQQMNNLVYVVKNNQTSPLCLKTELSFFFFTLCA